MPPPSPSVIVAGWSFEETGSADRADVTGNGHDAVPSHSDITAIAGQVGNGNQYPSPVGAQRYLEVPDHAALRIGQADQTYWGWAKGVGQISAVACYQKNNQIVAAFEGLAPTYLTWQMRADFYYGGAGAFRRLTHTIAFDTDWHFWAVEYIASSKTINLYFDDFTTPVDTDTLPGGENAATSTSSVIFGLATVDPSGQDETYVANAVLTQDEKDCVFNGGDGGTFPGFCQGNAGWLFYMMRAPSDVAISGQAYGTPTPIIFENPLQGYKYVRSREVVDRDGAQGGEQVEIKLVRDGTSVYNTDARRQTAMILDVAIPVSDEQ